MNNFSAVFQANLRDFSGSRVLEVNGKKYKTSTSSPPSSTLPVKLRHTVTPSLILSVCFFFLISSCNTFAFSPLQSCRKTRNHFQVSVPVYAGRASLALLPVSRLPVLEAVCGTDCTKHDAAEEGH